jgi:hypothetical protein
MQNPEAQRLEYCLDCHLAQISWKRGVGEHVLHCDGSGLSRNAQLQVTVNYSCLCSLHFLMLNHQCQVMSELCVETLWYGGQTDAIARQLNLCYIFILK